MNDQLIKAILPTKNCDSFIVNYDMYTHIRGKKIFRSSVGGGYNEVFEAWLSIREIGFLSGITSSWLAIKDVA